MENFILVLAVLFLAYEVTSYVRSSVVKEGTIVKTSFNYLVTSKDKALEFYRRHINFVIISQSLLIAFLTFTNMVVAYAFLDYRAKLIYVGSLESEEETAFPPSQSVYSQEIKPTLESEKIVVPQKIDSTFAISTQEVKIHPAVESHGIDTVSESFRFLNTISFGLLKNTVSLLTEETP